METFQIRTDLALEARESVNEEESKLRVCRWTSTMRKRRISALPR